jgi:hypothetical protein
MSSSIPKPTCCWVTRPAKFENEEFTTPQYCGKPVRYRVVDGRRKYDSLCDEHMKRKVVDEDET